MTAESLIGHQQSMCRMKPLKPLTPAVCLGTLAWSQPSPHTHWDTFQLTKHMVRQAHAPASRSRCVLHLPSFSAPPPQSRQQVLCNFRRGMSSGQGHKQPPVYQRDELPSTQTHWWCSDPRHVPVRTEEGARTSAGTGAPHLELLSNFCTTFFYQQLSSSPLSTSSFLTELLPVPPLAAPPATAQSPHQAPRIFSDPPVPCCASWPLPAKTAPELPKQRMVLMQICHPS